MILASLWAFMSQECTSLYFVRPHQCLFFCHWLVCFICILFHILPFVIVIISLTYHKFLSLHILIFSFISIHVPSFSVHCFFASFSRASRSQVQSSQSFQSLVVLSLDSIKYHNNVSIVFSAYFISFPSSLFISASIVVILYFVILSFSVSTYISLE